MKEDKLEKYLHVDGYIRASVMTATQVVEEMRNTLNAYDLATVILGRSMIGALLMASHLKKGENVGIYYRGNGPLGVLFAEGDHTGSTRAYTMKPQIQIPLKNNKLDISGAIGIGVLEVVRGKQSSDAISRGAVEIRTGQVGEDIAYYLYQSHQIPSVVALTVELKEDGSVKSAGGVLVELMPGAPDEIIEKIEAKVKTAKPLGEMIFKNATHEELLSEFLGDFKMVKLRHESKIQYQCRCSLDRVKRALTLLGHLELDDLIEKSTADSHEVNCDFCGRKYNLTIDEIRELRQKAYRSTLN